MDYRNRQLLIVLLLLLTLTTILYWVIWGNRGKIEIYVPSPFSVSVEDFGRFECNALPCTIRLPFGERNMCLEKEDHYPICEIKRIIWRKSIIWSPTLQRTPYVIDEKEINIESEDSRALPPPPPKNPDITYAPEGLFYHKQTGELFQKDFFGKENLVTRFYNLSNVSLLEFGKNAIVYTNNEVFYVDTKKKKKKRIFMGEDIQVKAASDTFLFIFYKNGIVLLYSESEKTTTLPFIAEPNHVVSCRDNTLRYATKSADIVTFFEYNLSSEKSSILASAKFQKDFILQCGRNDNEIRIHFRDAPDKTIQLK